MLIKDVGNLVRVTDRDVQLENKSVEEQGDLYHVAIRNGFVTVKPKTNSGTELKEFALFVKTSNLTWAKRLCSEHHSDASWKVIPNCFLAINISETKLFSCN